MNINKPETTDIFRGAFFLCVGGELKRISFESNRGNTATFIFTGSDLQKHEKDVNIYFKRHTPEEFEYLLKQSNPSSLEQSDKISKRKQSSVGWVDL